MTTATPRPLAKLQALLAGLQREVGEAKPRLRELLLAGDDTSGARRTASAAAKRILEIGSEIAANEGQRARARNTAIANDAAVIASAIIARVDAGLAALQPPSFHK